MSIEIIDIATEQTTAVTDLILTVMSIVAAIGIYKPGMQIQPLKTKIWLSVFVLLAIAAFFGAVAHGLKMSEQTNYLLWQPLNLALGLSVSLFAVGAIFDLRAGKLPKAVIPGMVSLGILFYFITVFIPGSFLIFIIYEAVVMLFALIVYIILASGKKLYGAWWMVFGILVTIIAAVIQATGTITLNLIWEFDHNGIFHIVQMGGILFIYMGLKRSFQQTVAKKKS